MQTWNYASYWRNSLADADSVKGALREKKDTKGFIPIPPKAFLDGKLPEEKVVDLFAEENKRRAEQNQKAREKESVTILYRPKLLKLKEQHGKIYEASQFPEILSPLVCPLRVNRDGSLFPFGQPFVPRDLLEPLDKDKLRIGSVDGLDRFRDNNKVPIPEVDKVGKIKAQTEEETWWPWSKYRDHCDRLCEAVYSEGLAAKEISDNYVERKSDWLLKCNYGQGASSSIIKLYDAITSSKPKLPLFTHYAEHQVTKHQPCCKMDQTVKLRKGHSSDHYALVDAQRDALGQVLSMQEGDILAVNGPPGTGKTTFLLSVVASLWVDAALEKSDPPLIVAASTNNQAVTNIIDAFGKDFAEGKGPFCGRWLPEDKVKSYGGYFPAANKEDQVAGKYQTKAFYGIVESEDFIGRAEVFFLDKARRAFPSLSKELSLEAAKTALHEKLVSLNQKLGKIHRCWRCYCETRERFEAVLGENSKEVLAELQADLDKKKRVVKVRNNDVNRFQNYQADESLWLSALALVPFFGRKRAARRQCFMRQELSREGQTLARECDFTQLGEHLNQAHEQTSVQCHRLEKAIVEKKSLQSEYERAQKAWLELAHELIEDHHGECPELDACDKAADTKIRFQMFRLAVHYWEVRWLIACKEVGFEALKKQNGLHPPTGLKTLEPRWKRHMMLTPCIVSTFHTLPSHFTYEVHKGRKCFEKKYFYNFIDLLIVDEAGQVSPEVAGASFALAKKALVVGDRHQLKPVPGFNDGAVDFGNLAEAKLIKKEDKGAYEAFQQTGRGVLEGSVMCIAQAASRFHYMPKMEPGMFLLEHRRCYDSIISFCNQLCYKGVLIPKRGSSPKGFGFRYLHVDGNVSGGLGGSRKNALEAETIAAWLAEHRENLETHYPGLPLHKSVAVITPFKAQEHEIIKACKRHGVIKKEKKKNEHPLTVGTVHALQGAERKVVIFSPVYSCHDDGPFIDKDNSMLNVAVSRAQDSFLVFGNMNPISRAKKGSPRDHLAQCLFGDPANELVFEPQKRDDWVVKTKGNAPSPLNDARAHDDYLMERLANASSEIHIVSPWIKLNRIEEIGVLAALPEVIKREVQVNIYTDRHFNTTRNNVEDDRSKYDFETCCQALDCLGAHVFIVNGVHSKLLMADNRYLCVGSFNWLSAVRQGRYANRAEQPW